ncbi:MAG: biotin--[acetyl-CoA-carboxylase] ligase [Bacteroidales bacterium]|nr:biotin--[acetyl-CoA-carboxylase] ligase [Bacteroidales bacterium]
MKYSPIGHQIIQLESVDSTNTYARELLKSKDSSAGTVIMTGNQLYGRGQYGNSWNSESGKNLTFSFILKESSLTTDNHYYLSITTSLGIWQFLKNINIPAEIKWPNDIYAGSKKIAGILIENSIQQNQIINSIIGIGINVNQILFPEQLPNPTSLKIELHKEFDLRVLLFQVLENLNFWFDKLFDEKYSEIKKAYLSHLLLYNKNTKFKTKQGIISGKITDVENDGRLVIGISDGQVRKFYFKELEFPV